jgi:hypothetical protein
MTKGTACRAVGVGVVTEATAVPIHVRPRLWAALPLPARATAAAAIESIPPAAAATAAAALRAVYGANAQVPRRRHGRARQLCDGSFGISRIAKLHEAKPAWAARGHVKLELGADDCIAIPIFEELKDLFLGRLGRRKPGNENLVPLPSAGRAWSSHAPCQEPKVRRDGFRVRSLR